MPRHWQHALQETVGTNGYVPLPPEIRAIVETDHPLDGPSVYWNYERNSNYAVLSQRPLTEPNYVDVGRYSVYDADAEGRQVRIRPPDRLDEVVRSHFAEGSRVVYLAYEEMADADNGTVYLLSTGQLLGLLPDAAGEEVTASADGGVSLEDSLSSLPGFLPAP